jgi:hypothetical protein
MFRGFRSAERPGHPSRISLCALRVGRGGRLESPWLCLESRVCPEKDRFAQNVGSQRAIQQWRSFQTSPRVRRISCLRSLVFSSSQRCPHFRHATVGDFALRTPPPLCSSPRRIFSFVSAVNLPPCASGTLSVDPHFGHGSRFICSSLMPRLYRDRGIDPIFWAETSVGTAFGPPYQMKASPPRRG